MLRFLWLALSLAGWGIVFCFLPRMPPNVLLLPAGVSLIGYLYGWIVHKRNWLIHFFVIGMWISVWISYQGMELFIAHAHALPFHIPSAVVAKTLMVMIMLVSGFLTFVNYRVSLNFTQRRGNIDRDLLGRLYGDDPWRRIKSLFKRHKGEVTILLGEEIPFKD
ncbi:hypothetical protein [Cohnella thermotolerans]|uniref:hypothetical protein n=1 Tax=Cohnella thermotolerans TaxID=329858 RepID=UPI00047D54FE|nr:hypothetical protein [Cohnella thermotolerans]